MKLLSNDKWYLCFHWIYFLKWVIKEVLLQLTMSIKEPADAWEQQQPQPGKTNGGGKKKPTLFRQFSEFHYLGKT